MVSSNKIMKILTSTLLFTILLIISVSAQNTQEMARADSLYDLYEEEAALKVYNKILQDHPQNFKALWRTSLLYSRIGYRLKNEEKKVAYFNKAKKRTEKALEINPANTYSNYVMGVAMGRMALISGVSERVEASRKIKKYAERSLRFDSTNAGAWHLLGRWHYEVDNLNFAERLAANVLFGGLPDGASTQKAARYIQNAIELKPEFILYYYDLAVVFAELDKEVKAISVCQEALKLPSITPTDPQKKEDCRRLINNLK